MNKFKSDLLSQIGETDISNLPLEKLKIVFLMAIRDFKKGKLKLEELSWFASELVQMPQIGDDKKTEELKEVIHNCSEIGYYLHQIPELDTDGKNTITFLLGTMEYYLKNKELLG